MLMQITQKHAAKTKINEKEKEVFFMNNTTHISRNQKKRIEKVRKMKAIIMCIIMIALTIISGALMIRFGIEDATGLLIFMFIGDAYIVDAFTSDKKKGGRK